MLRIQPIVNAKDAESYYAKSDGGYYVRPEDMHREWVGSGAARLGLSATPDFEQFKRLIHGLDAHTGRPLTARRGEGLAGWDVNVHSPKGVTTAFERGDNRISEAMWQAARETVADLEAYATTRVRKGKRQEDRLTGNLVGFAVPHFETRPTREDKMPDWHFHLHMVVFNLTHDGVEDEWKAVKFRPIMDLRKYFDRRFNQRFSSKLADLGYEIETKWISDGKGGRKYGGWDITGIPSPVVTRFSRRTGEIDALESEIVEEIQARDPDAPDTLSPTAKDKLGGTSRLHKRKDLTLADCREYWDTRITPEEGRAIAETIERARAGGNPIPDPKAAEAVEYALKHHFERQAVVPAERLAITAMERSMGAALPEDIEREATGQGVLLKDGLATTRDVLAQEERVIAFARSGRGTCRPLAAGARASLDGLSAEQQAVVRHIWSSPDEVILIEGDAGTGKTDAMKVTIPGIDRPGVFLAPSASASRGTLREKGFGNADTIARFLVDEKFREQARGGYIYIDEAPLAGIRQIDAVFAEAKKLDARVILQGDRKQHASVDRGSVFRVLEEFAGLPVARLTEIWRQTDNGYKRAVAAIARGDILGGYDILNELGWIQQTPVFDHNGPLVEEYMAAIGEKKPSGGPASVLVVAPSHKEREEITQALRERLRAEKLIGQEDHTFKTLTPLAWTEAERGDLEHRYEGTEILQFVRNSGSYRAGQRVAATEYRPKQAKPEHFAVYAPGEIQLAEGDTIRITANGRDKTGKHELNNGSTYRIAGFTGDGEIKLPNGWVLDKDFGHFTNGLVVTSYASQGRTVDRVLIAMGHESQPAISAEQFYTSVSRARQKATIFTNISPTLLREAIQRGDPRLSATELMQATEKPVPAPSFGEKARKFVDRVRQAYRQLRDKAAEAIYVPAREKETAHAR
jgi:conjugative relaxase-like TrwC/TraI family protein